MAGFRQETYLDRIKAIKSERKITNDKLAEMTGIPLGTLSKLLAGISDSPKLSNIVAISEALDCSLDYLITGVPRNTNNCTLTEDEIVFLENYRLLDGYGRSLTDAVVNMELDRAVRQQTAAAASYRDAVAERAARGATSVRRRRSAETHTEAAAPAMADASGMKSSLAGKAAEQQVSEPSSPRVLPTPTTRGARRRITLYDLPVSAGVGEFLSDAHASEISIPDVPQTVEAEYALRITGNSMEPNYHEGDVLLVRRAESVEVGELGIFVLDGCGYFKKFGGDRLISLNPAYPPILLKEYAETSCCGKVIGRMRRK